MTDSRDEPKEKKTGTNDDRWPALGQLQIFERLEVGPVRVEPRRLIAPYTLAGPGGEDRIELIYRYEEDVFDPAAEVDVNLASMIAAQVAVNYGLFCRTMVFRGIFQETDRRFLRDMTENTAREIYVKKILEPNPFLTGAAVQVPPLRLVRYSHARLEFPDERGRNGHGRWQLWPMESRRYAVLSSGGKDSLLSYGLLNEIGDEVHPIFVNESGRHWYTALNAYRHFRNHVPYTARVWMNADRVFPWMLRHMPFIRKDFATVRADDYPIRLWTVAVFLFGALPLLRKRHIGNLIIGDEYDTTRRLTSHGITHYDGLFDQSRYFDNALSRYFLRKGWSVAQFSILRPLSELLIQKILTLRYPELQRHQVSCHAAHMEGDRVRPCGRCEKCRRILGMLAALDVDPTPSGYREEQVPPALADLARKGIHQESAGFRHLLHLLDQKDKLELKPARRRTLREHSEVVHLRFDPERSPLNGLPQHLRQPLIEIWLPYTRGSLRREGREWRPFDPLSDPEFRRSYPFEIHPAGSAMISGDTSPPRPHVWGELTWPEAERRFEEVDIALLPVGSIEQHGPHLPLDTDAFDADYLARRVAEACSDPKPFVLPLIPYGVSYEHNAFKGTISITNDTLARLVYEIGLSLARNGIRKLIIINGHGGNDPALNHAAQMINRDAHIFVGVDTGETSDVDIYQLIDTPNDIHAGEVETSTSLAVRPQLVRQDLAATAVPEFSSRYLDFTSRRGVSWYAYTQHMSPSGVLGDPSRASAEKGHKIWQIMVAHLVALVEDLKNMTLEEIYQRRM
ncbi:MAG: creatininase family protein [Acidobacteria bacterium]|nr:creatininase family protein [Acidobacteriota bacterium]